MSSLRDWIRHHARRVAALLAGVLLGLGIGAHAATVVNQAHARFDDAGATRDVATNTVVARSAGIATLRFYTDASYTRQANASGLGGPLFLSANVADCDRDPNAAEQVQITVWSQRLKTPLTVTATETGNATGEFRAETWSEDPSSAAAARKTAQTAVAAAPDDIVQARIGDCGSGSAEALILIDPSGVVFDSTSGAPIAGASVTLLDVTGAGNGGAPNSAARVFDYDGVTLRPATVVTAADGRFSFPNLPQSRYRLQVVPPPGLVFPSTRASGTPPVSRTLHAQASFGAPFDVSAASGTVTADVPLDALPHGLFVQLAASRTSSEVGETLGYTAQVRNAGDAALAHVDLAVTLPRGFAYLPGSLRAEGRAAGEPGAAKGPVLRLPIENLGSGETRTFELRTRIGTQALAGDGVARAQATAPAPLTASSNIASARTEVATGVFNDRAMVLGKVYADCNRNGVQDAGEPGIPGVRLLMEDGTSAVTDGAGRYSLYGLSPKTHVLTLDATSLPAGLSPIASAQRHAGDGRSRFVDPRRGELQRGDFMLAGCTPEALAAVSARRAKLDELDGALKADFRADAAPAPLGDTRALPASGVIGADANKAANRSAAAAPVALRAAATPAVALPLERRFATLDATLGFVDLSDGQVLASPATIRVKGAAAANLTLEANGTPIAADRTGARLRDDGRGVQALEFVGVALTSGVDTLVLLARDDFGNVRGRAELSVRVAGPLARIGLVLPADAPSALPADSQLVPVRIELRDAAGLPVTERTALTLHASLGSWNVPDLDPREAGVQTFVEGGTAEFTLQAPGSAGSATLTASSAGITGEAGVRFVPALRPLIASGIVEGALQLRRLDRKAIHPASASDGFEAELRSFATSGDASANGRAALVLKGQVRGDMLLTLAYDSDKNTHERLFRDIQPDQFYPIYGDASVRGFDAQSTSRLYVRIDRGASSLLYGDFVSAESTRARQLGNVQRSLTGLKQHIETESVTANLYAARTNSRQVVDDLAGNGTSGPYALSASGLRENSEKVEVLVRDRREPSRVLRSHALQRFVDYELETLSGRLLMRAPVPSVDPDLNPISLRVTYEAEQGGTDFWVGGGDVQVQLDKALNIGGTLAVDRNPTDPSRLVSANATLKPTERTTLVAELAHVDRPETSGGGDARRAELQHEGERLTVRVHAAESSTDFVNPSATLGSGRREAGASAALRVDERTRLVAEVLASADLTTGARREGASVGIERSTDGGLKVEAGVRQVSDQPAAAGLVPATNDSVRARLSVPLPGSSAATAFREIEQDLHAADRHLVALGGDYKLASGSRVYARHELVSSLAGPLALDVAQKRQTSLVGIDTEAGKDGRFFSEYRLRDGLTGRDGEAAIGLRNQWQLAAGLRLTTSFERIHAVAGSNANENTAVTGALDYTADPLWKGSLRLEWRDGVTTRGVLATAGVARRLDDAWTLLGRTAFSRQSSSGDSAPATRAQQRFQLGAAYRDAARNQVNGLARYEFKREEGLADSALRAVHMVSAHADLQLDRRTVLTGQFAAKLAFERPPGSAPGAADGPRVRSDAQLIALRATRDFGERWDIGAALRLLTSQRFSSRAAGLGVEAGYRVATNLWLSAGWNVLGFRDRDLAADDATARGVSLRLRFKFDETLFGATPAQERS